MSAATEGRPGRFGDTGRRAGAVVWTAGLAVAATALLAAPAGAQAPPPSDTVFVHSAKSGELSGGRLSMHGVRPRVTWTHNSGRYGVMPVKRLHRLLFPGSQPAATGTLHVAGHRGGDELVFKLSKPRYNRAARTVSYRAKPLNNKPLPSRAARAAGVARPFGAASLSIIGTSPPSVSVTNNYSDCDGGTCWTGTLTASGLTPGAPVTVWGGLTGGNTGQGSEWDLQADGNGNINTTLGPPQPCRNGWHVYIGSINVSGGGVDQDFSTGCY